MLITIWQDTTTLERFGFITEAGVDLEKNKLRKGGGELRQRVNITLI
jgi:hypothetical protein